MVSYTAPKGWKKSEKPGTLSFSKEVQNKFCIITLYQSINASADAKKNFDLSWEALIEDNLGGGKATMHPGSTDKGWETLVGAAPFSKEGLEGVAILISSSKNNKVMNIVSITNTDVFQKEMETFLEKIVLRDETAALDTRKQATNDLDPDNIQRIDGLAPDNGNTSVAKPANNATAPAVKTPSHEVWMSYKYNMTYKKYAIAFFLKYADGSCLDYLPEEGMLGFSKATDKDASTRHWGTVKSVGNELHMIYPTNSTVRKLGKKTAMKMSYPPESEITFYYRCVPVDGLRFDGEYSSGGTYGNPNWYKNADHDKNDIIRFYHGIYI